MATRNKGEVELGFFILLCFVSVVGLGKVKGREEATEEKGKLSLVLKQMGLW